MEMDANKFWSKIEKSDCWNWKAAKNAKGYGLLSVDGTTKKAHRVAYELTYGPIENGLCVLHKCDNPACCNPSHLFLGTRADNNADMLAKGRHVSGSKKTPVDECFYKKGEAHHAAKLTKEKVVQMRLDRKSGLSYEQLGKKYGVRGSAAYKICNYLLWRTV
jgi:hypothetical protein